MYLSWFKSWRPGILNKNLHFPLLKGVAGTAQAKVFQKSFYHALSVLWYGDTKPKLGLPPLITFKSFGHGFSVFGGIWGPLKDSKTHLLNCEKYVTNIDPPKFLLDARPLKSYIPVSPKGERIVGFSSMAFRGEVVLNFRWRNISSPVLFPEDTLHVWPKNMVDQ